MLKLIISFLFSFVNIISSDYNQNIEFIQDHNLKNLSYNVGENQFINRTYIDGKYNYMVPYIPNRHYPMISIYSDNNHKNKVDWRNKHVVSSVKNQGMCGSCWAFSATEAVESEWAIKHHHLYNLSEQELVDCSGYLGNGGCDGGLMKNGFQYIMDNGICSNKSYPYTASDDQCLNTTCKHIVHITNYSGIIANSETQLEKAVQIQPVSVAIQANLQTFQLYKSGIYNDTNCSDELDHGVLLVGYGYDKKYKMKYWIIKNSWGESWGEQGYMRMIKDIDDPSGICGIAVDPSIPIINHSLSWVEI
tara:strand:+ start:401 stop:1315 length:915 start_codon:yes stop_codon:yes gene_type:complete